MLGAAVVFTALGFLWLVGCWLNYTDWGQKCQPEAPAFGWSVRPSSELDRPAWGREKGRSDGHGETIDPADSSVCRDRAVGDLYRRSSRAMDSPRKSPWLLFAIALGIVVFAVLFFDLAQVSMHSFYRNRLARAYLGASKLDAKKLSEQNRGRPMCDSMTTSSCAPFRRQALNLTRTKRTPRPRLFSRQFV